MTMKWCLPLVGALVAGLAAAQTTGTIVGSVTDASTGRPVAGATVVARGPGALRDQTALTDRKGAFRFDLLPPGSYRLLVPAFRGATEEGEAVEYSGAQRSEIVVRVDATLRANLALVPASVRMEEQVIRTGAPPVVDVGSAETGAVLTRDFLAGIPLGRDFADGAAVAPGAQPDLYGTSFAGATSPENGYLLDGMNVTDPGFGTQGTRLLTNFVEEVDVKSGSYMPEYGRATGGLVNVVTKSGSNEFHGSLFGNIMPGALSPAANVVGRDAEAIATRPAQSKEYQTDFGFDLGGPILKDRLWFYVGFAPVINHFVDERYYQALTEDPQHPGQVLRDPATGLAQGTRIGQSQLFPGCRPAGSLVCTQFNGTQYQVVGKVNLALEEGHDLGLSFFSAPQTREYLATGNATASAGLYQDQASSTDVIGRYAGKLLDKHLVVEAQGGWHRQAFTNGAGTVDVNGVPVDQRDTSAVRWDLTHNLTDFYDAGALGAEAFAACDPAAHPTFDPCPVTRFLTGGRGFIADDRLERASGRLAASVLFELGGHHIVKGGLDVERSTYDRTKFYSGGVFLREHEDGSFGATFQDAAGYAVLPDPPPTSTAADAIAFTSLHVNTISDSRALFLQDSWTLFDALTLNFGVRWEMQDMQKAGATQANLSIHDNVAPRVQAIYDFTGEGRGAIKASWGRFYENIPLDLGDRAFGGESRVVSERERCVAASARVAGSPASCDRIAGGNSDGSTYAAINGSPVPVAPDLEGQYVDMYGGSIEYEFLPDLSARFEYQGRRLGRVIEDMSVDDGASFFIANPGESKPFRDASGTLQNPRVATAIDPVTLRPVAVPEPAPDRRYDGFTFELRKRFSRKWLAQASYTYAILRGNYPGLFEENGQLDPNVLSEYDLVSLLPNRYGPLPGDAPHQVKLFASYVFDLTSRLKLQAGTAFRARSGTPVSYLGAHPVYGAGEAFILPRGSAGRTPWVTSLDLRGALEYALSPRYLLRFTLDVFNVLNQQQAVAVDQNYTFDSVRPIVNGQCGTRNAASSTAPTAAALADCPDLRYLRTTDGRAVTVNQNFGRPTQYQAPLAVRFGLALFF
jgi:Carboxypeptidase regulatory-like domain/TonB dependent receptor-like, beta-barrel